MRFPFRFMSFLALAFGIWVLVYLLLHRPSDGPSLGLALGGAALSITFGIYGLLHAARA